MLGRAGVIVWAALAVGCATRRVEDVAWEVEPATVRPVAVAIAADPPLPGESTKGWEGLAEAPADEGKGLTLEAAVALARVRNPALVGAEHDAEAARWSAVQAGRLPNPSVEVEAFPEHEVFEVEGGVEFALTDALLAPGRARAFRSVAEAERHRAAEAGVRLTYDVTAAYYAAVAAEARLGVAQRALDALAAARDVAEARVASGNGPALEAAAHTAAYERTRGEVAALELARETARERLNALLGLAGAETGWTLSGGLPPVPVPVEPAEGAEKQALAASHALAAARSRLDALARQGALARAEKGVPDVSVALLGAWEGAPSFREEGEWRAGVGLHTALPVFDGGRAEGRAWDARFDAEAARARGLVAETTSAVRSARARLVTAHARAVHERDVVLPAHRRLTRETLLHYNAMQLGVYELLQARAGELATELAHIETLRELWTANAAWDALLAGARVEGGGDNQTIELGGASAGGGH
jgi:cobalt-zinc-cadmium efflux system outer membrane protein